MPTPPKNRNQRSRTLANGHRVKLRTPTTWEPTEYERIQIEMLHGMFGLTVERIAELMICTPETLRKLFHHELQDGKNHILGRVAATMFQIATDRSSPQAVQAGKFILATQAGWTEKQHLEVHDVTPDKARTNDERLAELLEKLGAAHARREGGAVAVAGGRVPAPGKRTAH